MFDLFTPESRKQHHAPTIKLTLRIALQEPAIVKCRHGRPGGSTNRINNPTQGELSESERNTIWAQTGRSRGRAVGAIYRRQVEAAAHI